MKPTINRPSSLAPITEGLEHLTVKAKAIDSAIHHDGTKSGIIVPKTMSLLNAARSLEAYAKAEEAITEIHHTCITQHFYPAAYCLQQLLSKEYGIDFASPKPGMFGDDPPQKMTFPLSHNETATITIGQFNLAEMLVLTKMVTDDKDVPRLRITVTCKNRDEAQAAHLFHLLDNMPNPWQGKTLIFDEGREPRSVEIKQSTMTLEQIGLNPNEEAAMGLFIEQIRHHQELNDHGIPFHRGVLLSGPWGTGKTLAAAIFMAEAEKAGITVLHERSWKRLTQTLALARSMQPALVFCEDIDLMQSRDFINSLDDASMKDTQVSIMVTTNHPEKLDPALTRTGRLDIYMGFAIPEPATRAKILRINGCLRWSDELSEVTKGMTGSDLAEVAKRAMTYSIPTGIPITAKHLVSAAMTMAKPPKHQPPTDPMAKVMEYLNEHLGLNSIAVQVEDNGCTVQTIDSTVDRIESELQTTKSKVDKARNEAVGYKREIVTAIEEN